MKDPSSTSAILCLVSAILLFSRLALVFRIALISPLVLTCSKTTAQTGLPASSTPANFLFSTARNLLLLPEHGNPVAVEAALEARRVALGTEAALVPEIPRQNRQEKVVEAVALLHGHHVRVAADQLQEQPVLAPLEGEDAIVVLVGATGGGAFS